MKPVFSVKSAHLDALSIQLQSVEIDEIRETLQDQISNYLKFKALPFILDLQSIEDGSAVPFHDILALFALHELKIVGLRHTDSAWEEFAKQNDLVFIHDKPVQTQPEDAEVDETVAENAQNTSMDNVDVDADATQPENNTQATETTENVDNAADAFARELFGETENKENTPAEDSNEADSDSDDGVLANDNHAIKTVEMAQVAELVELSPEEAQKLAEANCTELNSEDGEAKGEIVSISEAKQTIVVSTPVRTGQQIYAEKADLIVLGIVSPGAEVIADGNIHIYAPLRGRALAGASGDRKARIFVQSMQAELVSIAGIYRTFEQNLPNHLSKQPVRIELQDDRLAISSIIAE